MSIGWSHAVMGLIQYALRSGDAALTTESRTSTWWSLDGARLGD